MFDTGIQSVLWKPYKKMIKTHNAQEDVNSAPTDCLFKFFLLPVWRCARTFFTLKKPKIDKYHFFKIQSSLVWFRHIKILSKLISLRYKLCARADDTKVDLRFSANATAEITSYGRHGCIYYWLIPCSYICRALAEGWSCESCKAHFSIRARSRSGARQGLMRTVGVLVPP